MIIMDDVESAITPTTKNRVRNALKRWAKLRSVLGIKVHSTPFVADDIWRVLLGLHKCIRCARSTTYEGICPECVKKAFLNPPQAAQS
jgi:hypothetical protein